MGLYLIDYNVSDRPVNDPFPICGSHIACTKAGSTIVCRCACEMGRVFPDPILKVAGQLFYYNGPWGRLRQKPKDKKVVNAKTAIAHEYYAHLDQAIDAVRPLLEALDQRTFNSAEECQGECTKVRTQVISLFKTKLQETQNAEEKSP